MSLITKLYNYFSPPIIVGGLVIDRQRKKIENLVISDGELRDYINFFGISPEMLRGKTVLDVGAGKTEKFSREAAKYGALVYSISPAYSSAKARKTVSSQPDWQKRSVAARAQQIPLKDQSFDLITALYSVSYYVEDEKEQLQCLKEMTRVLKESGCIFITPSKPNECWDRKRKAYRVIKWLCDESINWLKENNWYYYNYKYGPTLIGKEEVVQSYLQYQQANKFHTY